MTIVRLSLSETAAWVAAFITAGAIAAMSQGYDIGATDTLAGKYAWRDEIEYRRLVIHGASRKAHYGDISYV